MNEIMEERPLSEMTNDEIMSFIENLREKRKNVSLRKIEAREEKESVKKERIAKKKDTFAGDLGMNNLLDDILAGE